MNEKPQRVFKTLLKQIHECFPNKQFICGQHARIYTTFTQKLFRIQHQI